MPRDSSTEMSPELQRWLIATASELSPRLGTAIEAAGPRWFPDREDHGPAAFLARAIVGQQISAAAANGIWNRITTGAVEATAAVGDFLAACDEARLRTLGLSGNKAKAVRHIFEAHRTGTFEGLMDIDHLSRSERLTALWGIGQWTADMMAIFYYRELDIWPVGDLAVQKVFRSYIGRKSPLRAAARFAPRRTLLALSLWRLAGAKD